MFAIGASFVCYLASLFLPALELLPPWEQRVDGWECLVFGWSTLNPSWLANPAWLAALVLLGRGRFGVATSAGLGASALSLLTLLYVWRGWLIISVVVPGLKEADAPASWPASGFYAWSAAMWIPTLAAAFLWRQAKLEAEGGPGRF